MKEALIQSLQTLLPCNGLEAYAKEPYLSRLVFVATALLCENEKQNLTAITEPHDVALKHLVDSLTIAKEFPFGARVLDVGCGGGFPCLPLYAVRPDLHLTALDSTAKKLTFVAQTAKELERLAKEAGDLLPQEGSFATLCGRAEELGQSEAYRGSFAFVCSRAVANLPVLCELCLPFLSQNGQMIALKGKKGEEELAQAQNALRLLGAKTKKVLSFSLVDSNPIPPSEEESLKRTLLFFQKMAKTPPNYPRPFTQIRKKPL